MPWRRWASTSGFVAAPSETAVAIDRSADGSRPDAPAVEASSTTHRGRGCARRSAAAGARGQAVPQRLNFDSRSTASQRPVCSWSVNCDDASDRRLAQDIVLAIAGMRDAADARSSAGRKPRPATRRRLPRAMRTARFCGARSNARTRSVGSAAGSRPRNRCWNPTRRLGDVAVPAISRRPRAARRSPCEKATMAQRISPRPRLTFRPMEADDLDRVLENETRSYAFPWTRGVFSDCLKSRHECWVAERDGDIVGHGVLSIGANEAHLLNVCVRRDQQGQRLGSSDRRPHDRSGAAAPRNRRVSRSASVESRRGRAVCVARVSRDRLAQGLLSRARSATKTRVCWR